LFFPACDADIVPIKENVSLYTIPAGPPESPGDNSLFV
jgi:hypothetical protein